MARSIARAADKPLKVFISYSRRDAIAADALVDALSCRGFAVTIDRRDLPFGEKWQAELAEFIRLSDTVIWLVSEPSVQSEWVNWELDEVAKRNKRLVPVMVGEMAREALPRQLGQIHILPAQGLFDLSRDLDALVRVLETDRAWLKEASRLSDRAHEWLARDRASALLLRGAALLAAERWKERRSAKAPLPGQEVLDLLLASGQAATRRQRLWVASLSCMSVLFALVAGFALLQLYNVETARRLSDAQLLARVQPTEALLALSEIKDRWFADKSLLPQLSPELVNAKLTIARHVIGTPVFTAAWTTSGGYIAGTYDAMYHWSPSHRMIAKVPKHRRANDRGSGDHRISNAWLAGNGSVLLALDWSGCLRAFRVAQITAETWGAGGSPNCFNGAQEASSTSDGPVAVNEDGAIAEARGAVIQLRGEPVRIEPHLLDPGGNIKELTFDAQGRLFAWHDNGALAIISNDGHLIDVVAGQRRFGICANGTAWSTGDDGNLVTYREGKRSERALKGKGPWRLSHGCTLFVDDDGDLYRLDGEPTPLLRQPSLGWQNNANGVRSAFSKSDRLLALAFHDGRIQVYDLNTGNQFSLLGHTQRVFALSFDPTERRLLTASFDGTVRIFDLAETLIMQSDTFAGAAGVYAAIEGGPVVSKNPFRYHEVRSIAPSEKAEVPAGMVGKVRGIHHDWRIGHAFVLGDGDTNFVGTCRAEHCAEETITRRLRSDFIGDGGSVNARASADGDFIVAYEHEQAFSVFDLRRPDDKPILTVREERIRSATFDTRRRVLYVLRSELLATLPFGPQELSNAMQGRVTFCLTAEERKHLFNEYAWVAARRAQACEATIAEP